MFQHHQDSCLFIISKMQAPSISEITPSLFLGNGRCAYDPPTLRNNQINAVISLINAPLALWTRSIFTELISADRHLWIECVDSSTQDLLVHMHRVCTFIDQKPGVVLVHCDQGISRSATMVIAYLMREQRKGLEEVLAEVRAKRPRIKPSDNFMDQLKVWEQVGYQIWEDDERNIPKEAYRVYLERRAAVLKAKGLTGDEPIRPLSL
jgi:protein-tyrosine phosphatase